MTPSNRLPTAFQRYLPTLCRAAANGCQPPSNGMCSNSPIPPRPSAGLGGRHGLTERGRS